MLTRSSCVVSQQLCTVTSWVPIHVRLCIAWCAHEPSFLQGSVH